MQQVRKTSQGTVQPTRFAELRAHVNISTAPAGPPPAESKKVKRESDEERAERIERQAMAQHSTSLLKGVDPHKPYVRRGERDEKKRGGFLFQLILVMLAAAGIAAVLDPTLIPPQWIDTARDFVSQYVKI